jgi:capsular exopolysaccharide synthesis family protein
MASGDVPQITLRDYWRVLWRRKWIIVTAVLAAVVPAVVLTAQQTPVYRASAQMLVQNQSSVVVFGLGAFGTDPTRTIPNEVAIIEGEVVSRRAAEILGIEGFAPPVGASSSSTTDIVTLTVTGTDPTTIALVANAYVQAYVDVNREQKIEGVTAAINAVQGQITELQRQIDELDDQIAGANEEDAAALAARARFLTSQQDSYRQTLDQIQLEASLSRPAAQMVVPAVAPGQPFEPTPFRTALLALVVGLLLGLAAAFLLDYFDQSVKGPDDLLAIEPRSTLLAIIPIVQAKDTAPIAISAPRDPAVESYRGLRTNIQFLGLERDMKVIQVTSSMPAEGKTTTACNLAVVLSQTGARVLLVDADLRRPRVHQSFGFEPKYGLTDNLVGETLEMTLYPIDDSLTVLPAGRVPSNPSEMLSSRTMDSMLRTFRREYDYVILDSAPTLPVSDSVALARRVDGVIVVVQAGRTTAPQVQRTLSSLEQVSANVIGVVLNRVSKRGNSYEYGYGYGYGYEPPPTATTPPTATPAPTPAPTQTQV